MSRPLRILHVGKFYPPYMGGIETHLQSLCRVLSRTMDVSVLVANSNATDLNEIVDGLAVTRIATRFKVGSAPLCPGMVSRLRESKADIVHIHLPNPTAVLAYLASGRKGPLVVTYHSDTVKQPVLGALFEPILHRFLRLTSAIIVSSPNYLRSSAILQKHQNLCRTIPLGIPIQQFASCSSEPVVDVKNKYGDRILLAVGRMVYYKGFQYLIEAMTSVRAHLILVGDGPLRSELQGRAVELGVSERVTFLGVVDDIVPYYHAAEVFVLPSIARSEAFGIVQIEAMAAGTPVVNTDLDSGVPYVSQHGVTGLTVPPKNSAALADALNLLLDDSELRANCSRAACLRANGEFDVEVMADRTVALYNEILEGRSPKLQAVASAMSRS